MLSRMRMLSNLVVLVCVGLLFAGCLGLWARDQTVEEFFEEVSAAVLSQEAAKVADLWSYPFTFAGIKVDKEDIQAFFHVEFYMRLKVEGASLETFEIVDAEPNKIDIVISGDGKTAAVSNAALRTKVIHQDLPACISVNSITEYASIRSLITL